jgi:transposase InsO family protein
MEYFNKITCVTVDDLTTGDPPVMSLSNYQSLRKRQQINFIRRGGGLESYALIEYDSLPARFRYKFEALKGKPEELLKETLLPETLRLSKAARDFFATYKFNDGVSLTTEKQEEYTINASVLDQLILELNERNAYRHALGKQSTQCLWQTVAGTVERFREHPGHTLPQSLVRLKEKINTYQKEGFSCLISSKFGNANTLKITEEAGNFIVALKRSRVPVYSNEQIYREYNRACRERGWKPLKSLSSLTSFLGRPEVEPLWWDAVHGELSAKQRYTRRNKTQMPTLRDALWYGDGTKLNLYYKDYVQNKDGHTELVKRTTMVYEVMDAYSEVLLGYHISPTENQEQQYKAYRMAIERARCKPYEIVTDNQGGSKTTALQQFYKKLCRVARPTQAYNPQSKSIESAFGRLQSQILHEDWRFTGTNVTAKSGRPNLEFVEANTERLYTLAELKEAYREAREKWNNAPHHATGRPRIDMYLSSVNPEAQEIDPLDMIELFWVTTERPSTFTASGITIQVNNRSYTYEPVDEFGMPDMAFRRKHTNRAFFVQYDPQDMTHVRLFVDSALGKRFVADAYPYIEIHRATQEQEEGERSFLVRQNTINQRERVRRQMVAAELETAHGVAPEQHGLMRPRLKGLSAKRTEELMESVCLETEYEAVDIGRYEKELSGKTYDTIDHYDKF